MEVALSDLGGRGEGGGLGSRDGSSIRPRPVVQVREKLGDWFQLCCVGVLEFKKRGRAGDEVWEAIGGSVGSNQELVQEESGLRKGGPALGFKENLK